MAFKSSIQTETGSKIEVDVYSNDLMGGLIFVTITPDEPTKELRAISLTRAEAGEMIQNLRRAMGEG